MADVAETRGSDLGNEGTIRITYGERHFHYREGEGPYCKGRLEEFCRLAGNGRDL